MKPWYVRHTGLAWCIVIACSVAGSLASVVVGSAVYHLSMVSWHTTLTQTGFAIGGTLLGIAVGLVVVVSIRSTK